MKTTGKSSENNYKIVNSDRSLADFMSFVESLYQEKRFIKFTWDTARSSLSQKALFHIWCRQFAAKTLRISEKLVDENMERSTKQAIKRMCYNDTAYDFLIYESIDIFSPDKATIEYTSTSDWTPGEMFIVMEWFQSMAASRGIILQSKGEHRDNKQQ